ncbi:hypothetical protein Hanom_Chr04g00356371 [Helianthus anomalus]
MYKTLQHQSFSFSFSFLLFPFFFFSFIFFSFFLTQTNFIITSNISTYYYNYY